MPSIYVRFKELIADLTTLGILTGILSLIKLLSFKSFIYKSIDSKKDKDFSV